MKAPLQLQNPWHSEKVKERNISAAEAGQVNEGKNIDYGTRSCLPT